MVDFKQKLGVSVIEKEVNPIKIYDGLDRASDKGPLRPVQQELLQEWFSNYSNRKDVILKLHTGQGKTLVGLLILQSKLNQNSGPAVYLCPDKYLVKQTCKQAESFGIPFATAEDDLPFDFLDGSKILITTVNKLFNGETKFGLGAKSDKVSSIVMDDAHSCMNYIKKAYTVIIPKELEVYWQIFSLFKSELERQGIGTLQDIQDEDPDSFIAVPYWDWLAKYKQVVQLLASNKEAALSIKFPWPIVKDKIDQCRCIISGDRIEITPYSSPINIFGSYSNADHRVFMSATVNNDAFFIKELGITSETILKPLCVDEDSWSGEKMVLLPSVINDQLTRTVILNNFARPNEKRKMGIVAITPTFRKARDWESFGSIIADRDSLYSEIEKLKNGNYESTLVFANRYDGIDLPDNSCRVLILDSKPTGLTLEEKYIEYCRSDSEYMFIKTAQTIEQGLGRGVRGEKDYCAIVITGNELVKTFRNKETKKYFSPQTNKQVEIGLELAEFIVEEIREGGEPLPLFLKIIFQLLNRDEGWKEFYSERMNKLDRTIKNLDIIEMLEIENKAEMYFTQGNVEKAVKMIQSLIDDYHLEGEEKGWYLQEMARYMFVDHKIEANTLQISAHNNNASLFKPQTGMSIVKMTGVAFKRIENIIKKVKSFETHEELLNEVFSITEQLSFGNDSDKFENSLDKLGKILGFECQRPDKDWSQGPDNLWKLDNENYLLIECKNRVLTTRVEINKTETGQMNNACAWFSKEYDKTPAKIIMIIPTNKVAAAAGFNLNVEIMREHELTNLIRNTEDFFKEFKKCDFNSLSEEWVHSLLNHYNLSVEDILTGYTVQPKY